jgi:hypothetical protein
MIYFCRPVDASAREFDADQTLRWVSEDELKATRGFEVAGFGVSAPVPDDVRELALLAIQAARRLQHIGAKP